MKHLSLNRPHAIVMVGIPGSGKSFFAEKFAETFHIPYVDYKKIAVLAGPEQTEALADYQLDELFKTSQSIIIEGDTDTRISRTELTRKARKAGYEVLFIWVQSDMPTAKQRALKDKMSPISSDEYEKRVRRFTALTPLEKPVVISGKHTYASQAKVVLQRLAAPRAEISAHTTAPTRLEQPGRRNIAIR